MSRREYPFHGLNYPSDVRESDARAPWNARNFQTCDGCGRTFDADGGPLRPECGGFRGDVPPPVTAHGWRFNLCANCETEYSVCTECGDVSTSPEPRATVCTECAAAAVAGDGGDNATR